MTETRINEIIGSLAKHLQNRDYNSFVSFFTENAVFEIPFTVEGGTSLKGIAEIKQHFERISQNPLTKLTELEEVSVKVYHHTPGKSATVEYFTKGKALKTGEAFTVQSSIALLAFDDAGIVLYKDFPNTLGIAKKAGVLEQLVGTLIK